MTQRQEVLLTHIQKIPTSELNPAKLYALENGYDSFEYQLRYSSDPIALSRNKRPYEIINGRHRIHLARQKGMTRVTAIFV